MSVEVTSKTFEESLPAFREAVQRAEFLAFDLEFTGLPADDPADAGSRARSLDAPAKRYAQAARGARRFMILQVGVCAFYREGGRLVARPFCFAAFPRLPEGQGSGGSRGGERRRMVQPSSLAFLRRSGFDLNRVVDEGVTFRSYADTDATLAEARERESRREADAAREKQPTPVPSVQRDADFLDAVRARLRALSESGAAAAAGAAGPPPEVVEAMTGYQRMLVYRVAENEFDCLVAEKVPNTAPNMSHRPSIRVSYVAPAAMNAALDAKRAAAAREFNDRVEADAGLRRVIEAVASSRKPLVGHNMLLDVSHVVDSFVHPLPAAYLDFKRVVSAAFPRLYDTKLVASLAPVSGAVPSSVLTDLFRSTLEAPEFKGAPPVELQGGAGAGKQVEQAHDAGYDAYMTGVAFWRMLHHEAIYSGEGGAASDLAAAAAAAAAAKAEEPDAEMEDGQVEDDQEEKTAAAAAGASEKADEKPDAAAQALAAADGDVLVASLPEGAQRAFCAAARGKLPLWSCDTPMNLAGPDRYAFHHNQWVVPLRSLDASRPVTYDQVRTWFGAAHPGLAVQFQRASDTLGFVKLFLPSSAASDGALGPPPPAAAAGAKTPKSPRPERGARPARMHPDEMATLVALVSRQLPPHVFACTFVEHAASAGGAPANEGATAVQYALPWRLPAWHPFYAPEPKQPQQQGQGQGQQQKQRDPRTPGGDRSSKRQRTE